MTTALIHLSPRQKRGLARRAKLRGISFSQEVRNAIDFYLDLQVEDEEDVGALAKEASRAADRMIKRLDETIAYVDSSLKKMRHTRKLGLRGA